VVHKIFIQFPDEEYNVMCNVQSTGTALRKNCGEQQNLCLYLWLVKLWKFWK